MHITHKHQSTFTGLSYSWTMINVTKSESVCEYILFGIFGSKELEWYV